MKEKKCKLLKYSSEELQEKFKKIIEKDRRKRNKHKEKKIICSKCKNPSLELKDFYIGKKSLKRDSKCKECRRKEAKKRYHDRYKKTK